MLPVVAGHSGDPGHESVELLIRVGTAVVVGVVAVSVPVPGVRASVVWVRRVAGMMGPGAAGPVVPGAGAVVAGTAGAEGAEKEQVAATVTVTVTGVHAVAGT